MLQLPDLATAELNAAAWDILQDERKVAPELLPQTGISLEMEALLSSTFIQSPMYGTRCSNFLRMQVHQFTWLEKTQYGEQKGNIVQQQLNIEA